MKILYKIINSVITLALIPVLLFLPMFRFISVVGTSDTNPLGQLAGLLGGALSGLGSNLSINAIIAKITGIDIENLPEFYTIKEGYELFFGEKANDVFTQVNPDILPPEMVKWFTAAGILFIVALVFAVIVLICGLFVKQKSVTAIFAALGFACTLAANYCFDTIAHQLISGKISVVQILTQMDAFSKYKTIVEALNFDIRIFELSSAYTMMLVVFGLLVLLNIGFKLADNAKI